VAENFRCSDFWEILQSDHQSSNGLLTYCRKRHESLMPLAARSLPEGRAGEDRSAWVLPPAVAASRVGTWTSTRRLSTERHCKATVPARPLVASAGSVSGAYAGVGRGAPVWRCPVPLLCAGGRLPEAHRAAAVGRPRRAPGAVGVLSHRGHRATPPSNQGSVAWHPARWRETLWRSHRLQSCPSPCHCCPPRCPRPACA
jgi:hypothetical protein